MRVTLGLRRSTKGDELRIADNGLGISPGDRINMFELFYRAAPARAAGLAWDWPSSNYSWNRAGEL